MKVFFISLIILIPIYFWYRLVLRVDRIFFEGRTNTFVLYIAFLIGWLTIGVATAKILGA